MGDDIECDTSIPTVGVDMLFSVTFPGSDAVTKTAETVTVFEPPQDVVDGRAAVWAYRYSSFPAKIGMIRANRVQRLTQITPERTGYFSEEVFSGWGTILVPLGRVQAGFEVQARALKTYAEGK